MGSYLFINNHPAAKNTKTSYATFAKINVEQGIARLSDDDIADYLTAHNTSSDILNESDYDPDFDQLLNNITDDDIEQYLDQNNNATPKRFKGI